VKVKETLEQRIHDLERECVRFVHERAEELSKGTGLPVIVNEKMLMQAGGNPFQAALQVIATRKRDEEIAARQSRKSA
jgi:hypothetical protein